MNNVEQINELANNAIAKTVAAFNAAGMVAESKKVARIANVVDKQTALDADGKLFDSIPAAAHAALHTDRANNGIIAKFTLRRAMAITSAAVQANAMGDDDGTWLRHAERIAAGE